MSEAAVVELEDYRDVWLPVRARCRSCGHESLEVMHEDKITDTECAYCGEMTCDAVEIVSP